MCKPVIPEFFTVTEIVNNFFLLKNSYTLKNNGEKIEDQTLLLLCRKQLW